MDEQMRRDASRIITASYSELILDLAARNAGVGRVRDELAILNDEWTDTFAAARAAAAAQVARRWTGAR